MWENAVSTLLGADHRDRPVDRTVQGAEFDLLVAGRLDELNGKLSAEELDPIELLTREEFDEQEPGSAPTAFVRDPQLWGVWH